MWQFKIVLLIVLVCPSGLFSQDYPPEWKQYVTTGYISDLQHDKNVAGRSETEFKKYLVDIARSNIGKQIQVRITDYATLNKVSVNGKSEVIYTSTTQFSTDLNIKLVETKSYYNSFTKEGYAIAYINKAQATSAYVKEIRLIYGRIDKAIAIANAYVTTGFKTKARTELNNAKEEFSKLEEPLFWLSIYDYPENKLEDLLSERIVLEQELEQKLLELQYGIGVYVQCSADMFGTAYSQLEGDVKEILSSIGANFAVTPNSADWVIAIRSAAEEYNCVNIGSNLAYFSYVHANLTITKNATGQKIYEGEISEKGSHTHNYNQAARDGYKRITKQISDILIKNIK
ncbi:MAG: hypothetical protein IJY36_06630 [Coprobacter sp.]|nr:hypothetical protein [Coprobacter sp.]